MQWVKSHLTIVICGAMGFVSLVLLVLGILLTNLQEAMGADVGIYSNLQGMKGKAANDRVIDEVRGQQKKVKEQVDRFLKEAVATTEHKPLLPNVFPMYREEYNRIEFKKAFVRKQEELIERLDAQDSPSQQDVNDYQEYLNLQKKKEQLETGAPSFNPNNLTGATAELGLTDLVKLTPEELVRQSAAAGASVKRAREIDMYASVDSLDRKFDPKQEYPSIESMWMAQVGLWIQEDIISALVRLNDQEADRQKLSPEDRWVSNLPIKHLLYIAISDYVGAPGAPGAAGMAMPGAGRAAGTLMTAMQTQGPPPGTAEAVFTKRGSGPSVDVLQFALGLVIDARVLPNVIDEMSKMGFYTPLTVTYDAVDYDPTLQGYVYGPGPVIQVRLEFECCMLRDKYKDWMPESLKSPNRQATVQGAHGGMVPGRPTMMDGGRPGRGRPEDW